MEVFENVRNEDMFIIQSTSNPANDNIMELLIIADALRRSSAKRITAVIPYFGYARQDRRTKARTPISAKLIANLLSGAGIMPDILQSVGKFSVSDAAIWGGFLYASYALMQFLFSPIIGNISDAFGRRPIILISLFLMFVDYLILGFATSLWIFIIDDIEVKSVTRFEKGLVDYLRSECIELLEDLTNNDRKVDGELENSIKKASRSNVL